MVYRKRNSDKIRLDYVDVWLIFILMLNLVVMNVMSIEIPNIMFAVIKPTKF